MFTQIYLLRFPSDTSDQPFVYRLVKEYDIEFNILKADILLQREGVMIIELKGTSKSNVKAGLDYLREMGIKTEPYKTFEVGKMFIRYSWDMIVDLEEFQQISTHGEL